MAESFSRAIEWVRSLASGWDWAAVRDHPVWAALWKSAASPEGAALIARPQHEDGEDQHQGGDGEHQDRRRRPIAAKDPEHQQGDRHAGDQHLRQRDHDIAAD
ncbi:MAG: hypothetical protein IH626_20770, partial [Rhodospirillales bacterium]|nr:hypothetical protein [Rhodospirillales bacterium]